MDMLPLLLSAENAGGQVNTSYSTDGRAFIAIGEAATLGLSDPVLAGIPFANISGGAGFVEVDWVRIRKSQSPTVGASLGDVENL
jgi:hypothetical protein